MAANIVGVNERGFESANDLMTDGRDLPWLQENDDFPVWTTWAPVYRDVIILDANNVEVAVYNLTDNSLGEQENFDALKQLFVDAVTP